MDEMENITWSKKWDDPVCHSNWSLVRTLQLSILEGYRSLQKDKEQNRIKEAISSQEPAP